MSSFVKWRYWRKGGTGIMTVVSVQDIDGLSEKLGGILAKDLLWLW